MRIINIDDKDSLRDLMDDIRGKRVIAVKSDDEKHLILKFKDVCEEMIIMFESDLLANRKDSWLSVKIQVTESDEWII